MHVEHPLAARPSLILRRVFRQTRALHTRLYSRAGRLSVRSNKRAVPRYLFCRTRQRRGIFVTWVRNIISCMYSLRISACPSTPPAFPHRHLLFDSCLPRVYACVRSPADTRAMYSYDLHVPVLLYVCHHLGRLWAGKRANA